MSMGPGIDSIDVTEAERRLREDPDGPLLIDVRERAWSNRPEFRKTALSLALANHNIEYVHVREAGNPFRPRGGDIVDAVECMTRYRRYLSSTPAVVESVTRLIRRRRGALLCYEAKSEDCHRGVLVDALRRTSPNLIVSHL